MSSSLSNLVDNLSDIIHSDQCKCIDCKSYLDYMSVKNSQSNFRCFDCKNNFINALTKN